MTKNLVRIAGLRAEVRTLLCGYIGGEEEKLLALITWVSHRGKWIDPCTDHFDMVTAIRYPPDMRLGEPLTRLGHWNGKKVRAVAGN